MKVVVKIKIQAILDEILYLKPSFSKVTDSKQNPQKQRIR